MTPHLEFLLAVDPVAARRVWNPEVAKRGITSAVWAIPGTSLYIIDRQNESVFWCKEAVDTVNFFNDSDGLAYSIKAANAYLVHFEELTHSFHFTFVDNPQKRIPAEQIFKHYYPFLTDGFKLIKENFEDDDDFEEYFYE